MKPETIVWSVVREAGLEPARQRRQDLNLVRLPISPLAHCGVHCTEEHAEVRVLFVFQIAADSFGQCAAGSVVFSPRNFP